MHTKTFSIDMREQKIIAILGALVLILAGLYIYFINSGVGSITAYKAAEENIASLSSAVSALESQYLALSGEKVSLNYAYSLGFKDATANDIAYLVVGAKPTSLSLR
jgi:type II secretory pathway component PulM